MCHNSNAVTYLSFACVACTSNRSELSDEDDRGESREDIKAEGNNNMQSSTVHSTLEGINVNDHNEQQRNNTLRRIDFSLKREVRFEVGHDIEGEVGTFCDAMPTMEESSLEEEDEC